MQRKDVFFVFPSPSRDEKTAMKLSIFGMSMLVLRISYWLNEGKQGW